MCSIKLSQKSQLKCGLKNSAHSYNYRSWQGCLGFFIPNLYVYIYTHIHSFSFLFFSCMEGPHSQQMEKASDLTEVRATTKCCQRNVVNCLKEQISVSSSNFPLVSLGVASNRQIVVHSLTKTFIQTEYACLGPGRGRGEGSMCNPIPYLPDYRRKGKREYTHKIETFFMLKEAFSSLYQCFSCINTFS